MLHQATVSLSDASSKAYERLEAAMRAAVLMQQTSSMERVRALQHASKAMVALSRLRRGSMRGDTSPAGSPGEDTTDGGASSAAEKGDAGVGVSGTSKSVPLSTLGDANSAAAAKTWKRAGQKVGSKGGTSGVNPLEKTSANNAATSLGVPGRAAAGGGGGAASATEREQLA